MARSLVKGISNRAKLDKRISEQLLIFGRTNSSDGEGTLPHFSKKNNAR